MKRVIYLLVLVIGLWSCDKTETEPNPREAALGSYNYTAKIYELNLSGDGPLLNYLGSENDWTGTFNVSATASNIDGIIFDESGDKISAGNIGMVQEGFSFEIDTQSFTPDDVPYIINGFQGVTLTSEQGASKKFDGGYFSDTKKIQFYFQATSDSRTVVFEYTLTKI